VTMSFVFGRMTTKIILAHLTKQPFPYWTVLLTPLTIGAFIGNLPRFGLPMVNATFEVWYLRGYLVFAFVAYMHWALLVINRITTYLDINCLTIKRGKLAAREKVYRSFGESGPNVLNTRMDNLDGKGGPKNH
jgi:ethanolaminephosphotransferase